MAPARGHGRAPSTASARQQGEPPAGPARPAAALCAAGAGAGGRRSAGRPRSRSPSLRPPRTARLRRAAHSQRSAAVPAQPRCHRRPSPAAAAALPSRPYGRLPQARPADPAGPEGHGQPAPHQLHQGHERGRVRVSEAGGLRPGRTPAPRCASGDSRSSIPGRASIQRRGRGGWCREGLRRLPQPVNCCRGSHRRLPRAEFPFGLCCRCAEHRAGGMPGAHPSLRRAG